MFSASYWLTDLHDSNIPIQGEKHHSEKFVAPEYWAKRAWGWERLRRTACHQSSARLSRHGIGYRTDQDLQSPARGMCGEIDRRGRLIERKAMRN